MNLYIRTCTFSRLFYLLDPDPSLSIRIRIREAFINADPCRSGSATLILTEQILNKKFKKEGKMAY